MRGVMKVVTPEEFILWRAKQKAKYLQVFPDKDPISNTAGGCRYNKNAAGYSASSCEQVNQYPEKLINFIKIFS